MAPNEQADAPRGRSAGPGRPPPDPEMRLRFFDLSVDLLAIVGFNGYLLDMSPSWEQALGRTRTELGCRPYIEFVHPDDRERTQEEADRIRRGLPARHFENRYQHADGSYRTLYWKSKAEPGEELFHAVARDVTDRRSEEHKLQQLNAQLAHANELREEFIAVASHELRTPLTSIAGFSTTLLSYWDSLDDSDKLRFVKIIDGQATRLARLIDSLLILSRLRSGRLPVQIETVPLRHVLEATVQELDAEDINVDCPADLCVRADRDHLSQVFVNLLANALKYGAPPIALRAHAQAPESVVACVEDAGPGVPEEFESQLFEKFAQASRAADDATRGAGLGLSIVRSLVEAMDGQAWHERNEPRGARFCVRLPAAR